MKLSNTPHLASMIAPFDTAEFLTNYYGQKPLFIARQQPDFYQHVLTAEQLDEVLFHWPNVASIVNADKDEGGRKNLKNSVTQSHTPSVLNALDDGDTLILDQLDQRVPSLSQFNGALEADLHCPLQSNIYITPPNAKGFKAHVDDHHVFILQTQGSKAWRVNNLPAKDINKLSKNPQSHIDEENHRCLTLNAGDLLYIPAYTAHEALSQESYSVHITLSPHAPKLKHILQHLMEQEQFQSILEETLPLQYFSLEQGQLTELIQAGLKSLSHKVDDSYAETYRQYQQDNLRAYFKGALIERMMPSSTETSSDYCSNDYVYRHIETTDTELRIHLPKKIATFPIEFSEAVLFCLEQPTFNSADIPGMTEVETPILLTRLLAEGLITKA